MFKVALNALIPVVATFSRPSILVTFAASAAPPVTIVSTKPAEGENFTPDVDESILKIKIDPHPFIGKGGFDKEDVKGVVNDIRKIDGVKYFKQIGETELVGL